MDYLIKNAKAVDEGQIFEADVYINDGIISDMVRLADRGPASPMSGNGRQAAEVIDAKGKYLIPGIIDEHVHFREPGLTHKADISTESRAAVAGGVTSFMDMPNTMPQTTTRQLLEEKFALASQESLANYSFYLGATNDNMAELLSIDTSRVCGIKLFMGSSTGNMLVDDGDALETLFREAPCLIAAHCEDEAIIRRNTERLRAMADAGSIVPDATVHPDVRTADACFRSTARAVELAASTGARLHVMHISTAAELRLFRNDIPLEEKRITAETCPHYLRLDSGHYEKMGYAIKCNPAIKSSDDRVALVEAVHDGHIDTIGTDHAPHLKEEKFTDSYFTAKSGFPSIQHSADIVLSVPGMTIAEMVRLMCHNPALLYGIDRRGFIRKGYHADLAIVDLDSPGRISNETEFSKCGWTPYDGFEIRSRVTHTFVNGNLVYENGEFHDGYRGERLIFNR
ncbi:MAG: dihydroorotase [Bacteroidaceae bacterium]|nr:dihydroorotase [Bacteroidaceae bacterium]